MVGKPKRILIAEDERAYSRALELKLQNAGFAAEVAQNGEEAIMMVKKGGYDLVLCDLVMPKANGFAVLEEMQKAKIHIPTIVLSNLSQIDDEKKARALGAVDFLMKSNIQIADVINKVQHFLER